MGDFFVLQMENFFLLQMGDFFTEGVCFDTSKEGKGERQPHAPPFCEGQSKLRPCPVGKEQSEGPEPRRTLAH
jgi:hypothetical protein